MIEQANEIFKMANEDMVKLATELIRHQYKDHEITVLGIHIEKLVDTNEYVVTISFRATKLTRDGKIVIDRKIVMTKNGLKLTNETKQII